MTSLVHLATPMIAGGIAVYLGQEKLNAHLVGGVVVACVGAFSLSAIDAYFGDVPKEEEEKESSFVGILALFVGSFASAVYYNAQKITLRKPENAPLMVTTWEYAFGAVMMLLCALICVPIGSEDVAAVIENPPQTTNALFFAEGSNSDSSSSSSVAAMGEKVTKTITTSRWKLDRNGAFALFFAVVFNSILKYALSAYCNKRAGVTLLTVYSTVQPVFAALLAFIVLGQALRVGYLGVFAIFYGVWLVSVGRDKNAKFGAVKYDDNEQSSESSDDGVHPSASSDAK